MGWITDVYFPEGVELNDTKIRPGMSTQVRWNFGVGSIEFDSNGKVKATPTHLFPMRGEEADTYAKDLETWTGVMETNMGALFLKEGQLVHLDLSYEDVGDYFVNNVFLNWETRHRHPNLQAKMSEEQWVEMEKELVNYREQLTDPNVNPLNGFKSATEAYAKRSGELVDPFWKKPFANPPMGSHNSSGNKDSSGKVTVTFTTVVEGHPALEKEWAEHSLKDKE